jgi:catechol 2,3-dioxygenase-like lactoylglutathione lyase family enzyme
MKVKAVLESCLYGDDLEAAEVFYTEVLGLEVYKKTPGRHVFFQLEKGMFLFFNPERTRQIPPADAKFRVPAHGVAGEGHLAFSMDAKDYDHWKNRLIGNGVEIESEVDWPAGGRSIYFRDPAGNSLELAMASIWGQ